MSARKQLVAGMAQGLGISIATLEKAIDHARADVAKMEKLGYFDTQVRAEVSSRVSMEKRPNDKGGNTYILTKGKDVYEVEYCSYKVGGVWKDQCVVKLDGFVVSDRVLHNIYALRFKIAAGV